MPNFDDELQRLANQVRELFGVDAIIAANERAAHVARQAVRDDDPDYLRVFDDAFLSELRRVLEPH